MLEWILSSSVLILIVMGLRRALKGKISLRLQYALWALVLVRMLTPVSLFSSGISIQNVTNQVAQRPAVQVVREAAETRLPGPGYEEAYRQVVRDYQQQGLDVQNVSQTTLEQDVSRAMVSGLTWGEAIKNGLLVIWLTGCVGLLAFTAACNIRFQRKLKQNRIRLDIPYIAIPVYVSEFVPTPCICGVFRPTIYLTADIAADPQRMRHVVEHELTHHRHKDYLLSALRCVALALHWYNPLAWWAAKTSKQDAELACDEGTIARIGENQRTEYGVTLIRLTCERAKPADFMLAATTMSDDPNTIKERITMIAKKPKMAVYTLIAVVLIAALAVGCTFTSAREAENTETTETTTNTTKSTDATETTENTQPTQTEPTEESTDIFDWMTSEIVGYQTNEWVDIDQLSQQPQLYETIWDLPEGQSCANSQRFSMEDYLWEKVQNAYPRARGGTLVTGFELLANPEQSPDTYIYKMEFYITREKDQAQKHIAYPVFVLMAEWGDGQTQWALMDELNERELEAYDTPELVERYANKYAAAAAELRLTQLAEERGSMSVIEPGNTGNTYATMVEEWAKEHEVTMSLVGKAPEPEGPYRLTNEYIEWLTALLRMCNWVPYTESFDPAEEDQINYTVNCGTDTIIIWIADCMVTVRSEADDGTVTTAIYQVNPVDDPVSLFGLVSDIFNRLGKE